MGAYISLNQVLALAEKATNSSFRQIPRKKIMFRTTTAEGKSVTLCSPQSKLHSQGFFWVDITQEQYRVLSETDSGLVIVRLEGMKLAMVKWLELKAFLTAKCMQYNANEQNHWKLNLFSDHIKVVKNKEEMPIEIVSCIPE